MEVHQEWSVGEEKLLMCHLCEINSVNATAMPEIVYETVFGNITKEKGSVIFINVTVHSWCGIKPRPNRITTNGSG